MPSFRPLFTERASPGRCRFEARHTAPSASRPLTTAHETSAPVGSNTAFKELRTDQPHDRAARRARCEPAGGELRPGGHCVHAPSLRRRSLAQPAAVDPGGVAGWRPGNLPPRQETRLLERQAASSPRPTAPRSGRRRDRPRRLRSGSLIHAHCTVAGIRPRPVQTSGATSAHGG